MRKLALFLSLIFFSTSIFALEMPATTTNTTAAVDTTQKDTGKVKGVTVVVNNVTYGDLLKASKDSTATKAQANCHCTDQKDKSMEWISWVLMPLFLVCFLGLLIWSNVLRDGITNPEEFKKNALAIKKYAHSKDPLKLKPSFSLAKSQLGAWTIIIGCSYIYFLFQCCGPAIHFNATVLALLGISLTTTVVGTTIDKNDDPANFPTQGFFYDILSDNSGISIHRFQHVVFTIIAMVAYISKVCHCGTLPELDPTLLALTGASAAAYLGLKVNENKNTPPTQGTTTSANSTIPGKDTPPLG